MVALRKILAAVSTLGLALACSGKSDSSDGHGSGAGLGGHDSAGRGGTGAIGGSGGSAGNAHGGTTMSGGAGGAAAGTTGGAGTAGASAGRGEGAGRGGRSAAGNGGAGASGGADAGEGGGGTSGTAGAAGASGAGGKPCGGRTAATCDPGQYCRYESGTCGSTDEIGACTTQPGGIACVQGYACGCDGKVYPNLCQAHSAGVDVWSGNQCVPGDGMVGDACLTDDDCSGALKCCSSPIQVISCTTAMGSGCPLTP